VNYEKFFTLGKGSPDLQYYIHEEKRIEQGKNDGMIVSIAIFPLRVGLPFSSRTIASKGRGARITRESERSTPKERYLTNS